MARIGFASWALVFVACSGPSTGEPCGAERSGVSVCPGAPGVRGIDVSTYQGAIDWERVKEDGVAFAFVRVSDGTANIDGRFATNWRAMKRVGVLRGAYQFFRASEDANSQVLLMTRLIEFAGGLDTTDLGVAIDIETADGQSDETVRSQVSQWLRIAEQLTGHVPLLYTNSAMSPILGTAFGTYPLWVANWDTQCPTLPAGWPTWRFWQSSSTGVVSGIEAPVDLDQFDGTLGELLGISAGGSIEAGAPPPEAGGSSSECEVEP